MPNTEYSFLTCLIKCSGSYFHGVIASLPPFRFFARYIIKHFLLFFIRYIIKPFLLFFIRYIVESFLLFFIRYIIKSFLLFFIRYIIKPFLLFSSCILASPWVFSKYDFNNAELYFCSQQYFWNVPVDLSHV